ncbi:oxidoreductase, partial [Kitasatospora sp. NPDC093558]
MTSPTDIGAALQQDGDGPGAPVPFGLGSSPLRSDALPKALGIYPYAADLWAEGLLWGAVLRSPHPHARIKGIDTSAALALPGVHAVVTAADLPPGPDGLPDGAPAGPSVADRPELASGVV